MKRCSVIAPTCSVIVSTCWVIASASRVLAAAPPTAKIDKPKSLTVSGGLCRVKEDGTLGVNIGPNPSMPTLALTVGPGAFMAKEMHANLAKFAGPGKYQNEVVAVYLGKTALEDAYLGLATVTINADGKSGSFALNDGKASGTFDCGIKP